jgi:uncharacterized protein YaiE (UPF0345 family)
MITEIYKQVTLQTAANVYFDGKCVSHSFTLADGTKKSVGVVLASQLIFNTAAAEIMECVKGSCRYKLKGQSDWNSIAAGQSFNIEANSSFEIQVDDSFHYICHYA